MEILEIIIGIIALIAILLWYGKSKVDYDKMVTKMAIEEYEEERRRREDAEQALLELDELEKELNEKSRE